MRHILSRFDASGSSFSRGLDFQGLSLVLNFDLPRGDRAFEEFLHRVGRVGRFGRKGVAINLLAAADERNFGSIVDHYKMAVEDLPNDLGSLLG